MHIILISVCRNDNLVLHSSATVGCNLLTVVVFCIHSFPLVYRTMFVAPNVMLMNVMASRVFRNTKFGNQGMDLTTTLTIPSTAVQEPEENSSATPALGGTQPRAIGAPLKAEN